MSTNKRWNNRWKRPRSGGGGGGGKWPRRSSVPASPRTPCQPPQDSGNSPYHGWMEYFPDDIFNSESPLAGRLRVFTEVFSEILVDFALIEQISSKGSLTVSTEKIIDAVTETIPDFSDQLKNTPDITIRTMSLAVYHCLVQLEVGSQAMQNLPLLIVRLSDFSPITPLKELRANLYGKFVTVHGTVVRVSDIRPLVTHLQFSCSSCSQNFAHPLKDGKYSTPGVCCGGPMSPTHAGPLTRTTDIQKVRLQEVVTEEQNEPGRIPRTVECELTGDLVGACIPGENVQITGIVKVHQGGEEQKVRKDKCVFLLYIHANFVGSSSATGDSALVISMDDIDSITAVADRYPFGALVSSLCPTIFGHSLVKAGLILALVGGTERPTTSGIHKRSDSHVLVVGDPGLGKSQLLQAVSNIAPRGVYVCGNSATSAGLTVSLSRDGSDTVLEAGALVLADKGCCCIDEFDKMAGQHSALLEAMEQQSISIAKAGMVCSLPARTSIIAAANPIGGHYNPRKTVSENLKLSGPLLSRFDLIFILLDRPDTGLDKFLSENILAMHAGESGSQIDLFESDLPLEQKLLSCKEVLEPLLLKKYLAHCRATVHPTLSDEARSILKEFYLQLRAEDSNEDTPVTTRQLESLIRLTESRARVGLRDVASGADAIDVVEIFQHCLRDVRSEGAGPGRAGEGKCMGVGKASKLLIAALNKHSERTKWPGMKGALFLCSILHIISTTNYDLISSIRDSLTTPSFCEGNSIQVAVFDGISLSYPEQLTLVSSHHVLMSVHGAALAHSPFLSQPSALFELFNAGEDYCYRYMILKESRL
eukprot:sb/3462137/